MFIAETGFRGGVCKLRHEPGEFIVDIVVLERLERILERGHVGVDGCLRIVEVFSGNRRGKYIVVIVDDPYRQRQQLDIGFHRYTCLVA